jgi:hypothetical protein
MALQVEPKIRGGVKGTGQAQRHIRGDGPSLVDDLAQLLSGTAEGVCQSLDGYGQGNEIVLPNDCARVCGRSWSLFSAADVLPVTAGPDGSLRPC